MKTSDPLVIIGRCVAVGYLDDKGERKIGFPKTKLLAWKGPKRGGDLVIVTDLGALDDPVTDKRGTYHNFHGFDATMMREVDWTPPKPDRLTIVGLASWVQYRIPAPMRSDKEGSDWVHHFGDFGKGDWRKENKYKPHFARDSSGHFYIERRAGNAYYLDQWIEG